jgi:hypothetical protein
MWTMRFLQLLSQWSPPKLRIIFTIAIQNVELINSWKTLKIRNNSLTIWQTNSVPLFLVSNFSSFIIFFCLFVYFTSVICDYIYTSSMKVQIQIRRYYLPHQSTEDLLNTTHFWDLHQYILLYNFSAMTVNR